MKILLLCPDVSLDRMSGGSTHEIELSEKLAKKSELVVMGHGAKDETKDNDYQMRTCPWIKNPIRKRSSRKIVERIDGIIKEIKPDVVYYRVEPFEAFGLLTKTSKPIVAEFNYNFFATHKWIPGRNFLLGQWLKKLLSKVSATTAVSNWTNKIMNLNGVVIPNGANPDKFKLGRGEDIVFVGGAGKHQGADLLTEVNIDRKIAIAGGFDLNQKFVERVKAKTKDNIEFIGRVDDVPKLLKNYGIGAAPYRDVKQGYGYSPIKVFEYMAAGLVSVVSDSVWNKEIINDKNGILFRTGDAGDLEIKLKELIDDKQLANRLGRNARKNVERYYNWKRAAGQVLEVCEKVLENS
jgi:glycosyltransferase involved in cell wall biosynthesis